MSGIDNDERYERARDLAEEALAEYARGENARGDTLAEQAVKTDRGAVEELVRELEQDTRGAEDDKPPGPGKPAP